MYVQSIILSFFFEFFQKNKNGSQDRKGFKFDISDSFRYCPSVIVLIHKTAEEEKNQPPNQNCACHLFVHTFVRTSTSTSTGSSSSKRRELREEFVEKKWCGVWCFPISKNVSDPSGICNNTRTYYK